MWESGNLAIFDLAMANRQSIADLKLANVEIDRRSQTADYSHGETARLPDLK